MSKNQSKKKKIKKVVNIEEENPQIFWTAWVIIVKFSEKACLMIMLKVQKIGILLSDSRKDSFGKPRGGSSCPPLCIFRVKI